MTGYIVYMAVFTITFFAASFLIARCTYESPTEPSNFLMSVGLSLMWPLTLPLAVTIYLLFVLARMAEALAEKRKGD